MLELNFTFAYVRTLEYRAAVIGVALSVYVTFAIFYMNRPMRLDFPWAGWCLVGTVYFMFASESATDEDSPA